MKHKIFLVTISISILIVFSGCMGVSHLGHATEAYAMQTNGANDTIQANLNNQVPAQVTPKVFTCPMHPEVLSDKPGKCPKCSMELVVQNPVENSHDHNKMGCMGMMHSHNNKSHIGIYLGGGAMMIGMMALMMIRFL